MDLADEPGGRGKQQRLNCAEPASHRTILCLLTNPPFLFASAGVFQQARPETDGRVRRAVHPRRGFLRNPRVRRRVREIRPQGLVGAPRVLISERLRRVTPPTPAIIHAQLPVVSTSS